MVDSHASTIELDNLPRHDRPPRVPAFIAYLARRLQAEDPSYSCSVSSPSPPIRQRAHLSHEEEHDCINFSGVDIFQYAQDFDEDPQNKDQRSTWAVNILTSFFFVLTLLMCLVLVVVYTLPRLMRNRYRMSLGARDAPFDTQLHPYRWSRLMAIWVVYVPQTKIAGMGGLAAILLPSLRPAFQHAYNNELKEGKKRMEPRRKAKQNLEQLYARLLIEESEALEAAVDPACEDVQKVFEGVRAKADSIRTVKGCLAELEAELNNIEEIVATEECFQRTGYKGIADWANDAWNANQNFINTIVAICMLGVGITYSSIFSANRGDIGYMCWSFSLFMSGLALSTMTQLVLLWTTQLPEYAISTVSVCQILLGVALYGAVGFLISAVYVLVLSVQQLGYTAHPPTDAHLVFTTGPRPPAFLALSIMSACSLAVGVAFLLFSSVDGAKVFLRKRSSKPRRSLEDYPMFGVKKE